MNKTNLSESNWAKHLVSYGVAAGALSAGVSQAAEIAFDPAGGLPIALDSQTNMRVDLDIDGDGTNDFEVYYDTEYGGGFSIGSYVINGDNRVRGYVPQRDTVLFSAGMATRYDTGEVISEEGLGNTPSTFLTEFQRGLIDAGGNTFSLPPKYEPFRNTPGFVGFVIQPSGALQPLVGYLEVVVSNDGQQMLILSGAYQDANFDDEIVPPAVTPPGGLSKLAIGAD